MLRLFLVLLITYTSHLHADELKSTLAFEDTFTETKWQDNWFLDGKGAKAVNKKEGLELDPGKGFAVLWTKNEFQGDLKIEYDFKRLDNKDWGVNIIYIQAQGDEEKGFEKDISLWSNKRTEAAMKNYFLNMHTYHISYAAYPTKEKGNDYLRARRYLPLKNKGLKGTKLQGEYENTGLFEDHKWVRISIIKKDKEIWAEFKHPDKTLKCHFKNTDKAAIKEGRIGLRIMPGRKSQFKNFKVYKLEAGK